MSDEQVVTAAEREYQARLVALHDASGRAASAWARCAATTWIAATEATRRRPTPNWWPGSMGLRAVAERGRTPRPAPVLRRLTDTDYEPLEVAERTGCRALRTAPVPGEP